MRILTVNPESITDENNDKIHLYSVIVTTPSKGTETHFILAKDEVDAASMARCAAGWASYDLPDYVSDAVKTHATKVPLTVMGWGKFKY